MEDIKLIKSKLSIPSNTGAVSRKRLEDLILEIENKKALIVSAPAGFGKTTLVSQSLRHLDHDLVWFSIDEYDRDFMIFFTYIIHGFKKIYPGFGDDLLSKFNKTALNEKLKKDFIYSLTASIDEILENDLILVFDDFHLVEKMADIIDALEFLISRMPYHLHIIFITRTLPDIKISKLRSMMDLIEINEKDLLFTHGEIKNLLKDKYENIYDDELVLAIESSTGGWAAAITLFLYDISNNSKSTKIRVKDFNNSQDFISNYIEENIFLNLSRNKRDFMIKSSLLKRIDLDLCEAVFSEYEPEKILKELVNDHFLTSGYIEEEGAYRYHHLLQDFLKDRLDKTFSEDEVRDLYKKIGDYYRVNNNLEYSMLFYLEGKYYDDLSKLIGNLVLKDVISVPIDLIHDVTKKIPDDILFKSADLLYVKSRVLSIKGLFSESLFLSKHALKLFRAANNKFGEMNCLKDIGFHSYLQGDMYSAIEYLELVIEKGRDADYILLEAGGLLLFFLSVAGRFEKAEFYYDFLLKELKNKGLENDEFSTNWLKFCFIYRYQNDGDFEKADGFYKDCYEYFLNSDMSNIHPLVLFHKTLMQFYLFDFSSGLKTAQIAIDVIEDRGITDHQLGWIKSCICLNLFGLKRFDEALKAAEEVYAFFNEKEYPWGISSGFYLKALVNTALEDFLSAEECALNGIDAIKNLDLKPFEGALKNLLGRIWAVMGKRSELDLLVKENRDIMTNTIFNRFRFYIFILRAEIVDKDSSDYIVYCEKLMQMVGRYKYEKWLMLEDDWCVSFLNFCIDNRISINLSKKILNEIKPLNKDNNFDLEINCLGSFEVKAEKRKISGMGWKSINAQNIFKYLILKRGTGLVKKDVLMEFLWPDQDPDITKGRFHVEMSKLRKILEPDLKRGTPSNFILSQKDSYELNPDLNIHIDIESFIKEIKKGDEAKDKNIVINHYLKAYKMYIGPLFSGAGYESFFIEEANYLNEKYLGLLIKIINFYEEDNNFIEAAKICKKYLETDPYAESLYRRLMNLYFKSGETSKIKTTYELCEKNIKKELDSPLSEKTTNLYIQLLES